MQFRVTKFQRSKLMRHGGSKVIKSCLCKILFKFSIICNWMRKYSTTNFFFIKRKVDFEQIESFFSSHKNRVVQRLPIPVIGYRCNGSLEQLRQISLVLFWNTTKIKRFMLNLILSWMKNHNFIRKPRTYVVFSGFLFYFMLLYFFPIY